MTPNLTARQATYEAFFNQTHTLFGRELLPFSLRHWLLLSMLQSPLIVGGTVELSDMRLAVVACSTKTDAEFIEACRFEDEYWKTWKAFTSHLDLQAALNAFNHYVEDYLPQFPLWKNEEASNEEKLDGFLVAAARLLESCTPDYVENMPLGKMLAWVMAKNEAEGFSNKNLMSDVEVSAVQQMEQEPS